MITIRKTWDEIRYFTLSKVKCWDPMIQVLNIMYTFIHLCDDLQYLLAVAYITICNGFVFRLGDSPLSVS